MLTGSSSIRLEPYARRCKRRGRWTSGTISSWPRPGRGALDGLVFVAVSINLQEIVSDPGSGLPGRAAEALILLVGVLMASVLLLVPGQGQVMVGAEVLVVGLVTWGCVVAIQLLRLRSWGTMRPDLRQPFVLRVALGQIATLPLVVAGIAVLVAGLGSLY